MLLLYTGRDNYAHKHNRHLKSSYQLNIYYIDIQKIDIQKLWKIKRLNMQQ